MAKGLKFRIKEAEGFYYPCSENKGADQLLGYREVDLRLCFRICKSRFSHNEAHIHSISCTYSRANIFDKFHELLCNKLSNKLKYYMHIILKAFD